MEDAMTSLPSRTMTLLLLPAFLVLQIGCISAPSAQKISSIETSVNGQVTNAEEYEVSDRASLRPQRKVAHPAAAGLNPSYIPFATEPINTEEYGRIFENSYRAAKREPLSTFSIDVDAASYANARRFLSEGQIPPKDAVHIEEFVNYFRYDYPAPKTDEPFSITAELARCPWQPEHHLMLVGLKGREVETKKLPPANLVFLVDTSGSMEDPQKLPLLKQSFRMLVEQLRPQDRVSIVTYAGSAGLVLPATSGGKKAKILEALERLHAGGSTAGGEGIQLAYETARKHFLKNGNNRVILATDGDFNVGVSSEGELVRLIEKEREAGVFLTVLGFGTGNYKDSKMEKLADTGNGNYAYVDSPLEARRVLVQQMGGTLLTIAKDVKIQVEFNPAKVKGYRLIGYENRLLTAEQFNDDKKDAGELGAGHTVTALYEIVPPEATTTIPSVDPLKYQPNAAASSSASREWATVKLRYKEPQGKTSRLLAQTVTTAPESFDQASETLRFASSAAGFAMLLRDSEFKGTLTYDLVRTMAKPSISFDPDGWRAEFVSLVEKARMLQASLPAPDKVAQR
jgi:Ca-activated chloride channel family protein